ncbi:MAG: D-alanyl-D-alanine carboxypeptidase family protein [Dorea sp.]
MRCTDNSRRKRARRKRRIRAMRRLLLLLCFIAIGIFVYKYIMPEKTLVVEYETKTFTSSFYRGKTYASDLCVVSDNIDTEGAPGTDELKSAGLFNLCDAQTEYAYNVHEKLYPASTTKIMTALLAIKSNDLSEIVTVGPNADSDNFAYDEATCGIHEGDQITLEDLLYGLLLYSGNDTAVAIAEHVGGTVEVFAEMMNAQAAELMATNTHFVNPSGLFDESHYTTAYDLYLIFNECIKHEEFVEIIGSSSYTAQITGKDGTTRTLDLEPTNYYAVGKAEKPENITIVGGKTGTLQAAGNCLILLEKDKNDEPYISIIMGADTKDILYRDMTTLIKVIPDYNS